MGRNPSYCQIALPPCGQPGQPEARRGGGWQRWHYPQISVYGFIGAAAASRLLSLLMSPLFLFFSNLLSSISFFSSHCVLSPYSRYAFIAMYLILVPPSISPLPPFSFLNSISSSNQCPCLYYKVNRCLARYSPRRQTCSSHNST